MPTISVDKAELFKALGREFTTEQFDELCFEFGIELDEDTTDSKRPIVDGVEEPPQLKIEIPANRYFFLQNPLCPLPSLITLQDMTCSASRALP